MKLARFAPFALLLLSLPAVNAQPAPDCAGHWEGAIQAPGKEVKIAVDLLARDGKLVGTFDNPSGNEHGFPLSEVAQHGKEVTFAIKATSGGGVFQGALAADGKSISGDFVTAHGMSLPFTLTRTGEGKIDAPPASATIAPELEGAWRGTLGVKGEEHTIGLTLANHPDGTSTGNLVTSEGVDIAVTKISAAGGTLTLDVKNVAGSWQGKLSDDGTALVGTWTQGSAAIPLTFRRAGAK
jgi:hypothetical protein